MNKEQEQELLDNVKSLTDRMTMVDEVFKQLRVGREMVLAFQCGHSGLYLPGDYVKNWGRPYGVGLGPHPVSEVLDTDYYTNPPAITPEIESFDQIMHPVGTSFAQVDYMLVERAAFEENSAVLVKDDAHMRIRARIVRQKQLANPRSKLRILQMAWNQAGKQVA